MAPSLGIPWAPRLILGGQTDWVTAVDYARGDAIVHHTGT